jgi:hypothetical protein
LRVFVSSTVYNYEELLESIYAQLELMGYEVVMSHKGTVPVDPSVHAFDSCLQSVRDSDLFLGVILPSYGSGKEEEKGFSITHREALLAIELDMPRWFLVHEHVAVARQLLSPYRDEKATDGFKFKPGIDFKRTPILSDLKVLDLYEAAMRHDMKEVKNRKGNWVQTFGTDDDARLFVNAQFRRQRELLEKHLPKLADEQAIRSRVSAIKGDKS